MKEFANLHCHTQLSDGSESPISFLKKAARYTRYCAITDHNRLISSDEMFLWSHAVPEVTLVPGAEMAGDHPAGLEVFYYRYYHDPALIKKLQNLADRYNLLPSCGSDFHDLQNDTLNPGFPAEIYLNLFSAHQNYYRTQR